MFRQRQWPFNGTSGKEYYFTILPKSEGLPDDPGVFIMAYTHPRGHMSGWLVTPLHLGHAENMGSALAGKPPLDPDREAMWNCNFVLLEPDASVREACVRDLGGDSMRRFVVSQP